MRNLMSVVPIAVLAGLLSAPTVAAAQEDEVRAAIHETLTAWREGNFATFANFYHPATRGFLFDGGLLVTGFNPMLLQAAYDAGFRAEVEVRDIDVKMYGAVAIAVAYGDGTLTLPGGATESGTWRYTETRVKEEGTWKIVQYHFSKLQTQ